MSPGPTSSKAEDVFPAGTHTKAHIYTTYIHIYMYTYIHVYIYTYIHGWPHRSQTDTKSTHTNIDSTNGLILLPSLAGQDGSPLVRVYIYICTRWIPPAAGLRHSVCPVAGPLDSSLPSCWHLDIQAPEVTALLRLLVQTVTRTQLARSPSRALVLRDTQALSHPEMALRDPLTLLLPGHFTYSRASPA